MLLEPQRSPPHPLLRDFIESYWTLKNETHGASFAHCVLPDLCSDLIFSLGPRRLFGFTGNSQLIGVMSSSHRGRVDAGTELFGVRFQPFGVSRWLKIPINELRDSQAAMREIGLRNFDVRENLVELNSFSERCEFVDRMFLKHSSLMRDVDSQIVGAGKIILDSRGLKSIEAISQEVGVSRRQLVRSFSLFNGLNPKLFARIVRVRYLISLLSKSPIALWSSVALDGGFYDQSHMIREFKDVLGMTPGEFCSKLPVERQKALFSVNRGFYKKSR